MPANRTLSGRLLIVSNRLPVTARSAADGVRLTLASGGLATGLRPWHEQSGGLWIGWPGDVSRFTAAQRDQLDRQLAGRGIVPVHLSVEQIDRYYHGFSNRVLWPLFHYLIDRVPVDAAGWESYRQVNETFAAAVAREYRPGDLIWVHDYQLMLVPALVRQKLPEARIGFFLHIPFPSSEVFRILPYRREILNGLLGANLVGFHTYSYMRHFAASLLHVGGVEADIDRVRAGDREVTLGVFPMGVDAEGFASLARSPGIATDVAAIRRDAGERRILLGVDRLDYTKGIPRRLQAIERLLARDPDLRDTIRYIQVAVPSRGEVDSYQRFRRQVEEMVGRINGTCGTLGSTPVHYIHRSVSMRQLTALYRAADVMLVTPLRDGMNLVAKEFLAARVDEDGMLVLSEFAGAAAELDGAFVVNPYDVDGVAEAIRKALALPREERQARMRTARRRVFEYDVHAWADAFLARLSAEAPSDRRPASARHPALETAIAQARQSPSLHLLLDYDGTLVPLARAPELAVPDAELLSLLDTLTAVPGLELQLVSGRPRDTLETWFGQLPLSLWAEHGFWHRPGPDAPWRATARLSPAWMARVVPILEQFTTTTPGSRIETKSASVAWHFREAGAEFGVRKAHELRMLLTDALSNQPLEVLEGKKIIEVRLRGVSKAIVARSIEHNTPAGEGALIAIGDDETDEDLFAALPPSSLTISVGHRVTRAKYTVPDHHAVRQLLASLVADSGARSRRLAVAGGRE
jgi:trehalose 6-phosphate synthase/phosphatase